MPTASSQPWRNGTWPVWPKRCCRFWTPAISTSWNGWNRWWPGLPCALTGIGPGSCAPSWDWPLKSRTTAPRRTTLQLLREKVDFTLAFRLPSDAITGPDAALRPVRTGAPGALGLAGALAPAHGLEGQDLAGLRRNGVVGQSLRDPAQSPGGAALSSAVDEADLGPFERLLAVLGRPYETVESARPFTLPASPKWPQPTAPSAAPDWGTQRFLKGDFA